jgi:hypothetical protein
MADGQFQIKISSDYDGKGAKQSADDLKNIGKEAEHANEPLKETAKIHEDTGEKAKTGGKKQVEAAEKSTLSHRELREALHGVGHEFGGLSNAALWANPQLAALAAVLLAVEKLKEYFTDLAQKELDAVRAAQEINSGHLDAVADAVRATTTAVNEYTRSLENATTAQEAENQAMEDAIALYAAKIDGMKQVEEAEEKAFEAKMDEMASEGSITKDQAEEQKDLARERLRLRISELDKQKEQEAISEHENQLAQARARIPQEQQEYVAATHAVEPHTSAASDHDKEVVRQQKILDKQLADLAADQALAAQLRKPWSLPSIMSGAESAMLGHPQVDVVGQQEFAATQKRIAARETEISQQRQYIENLKNRSQSEMEAGKDAKQKAEQIGKSLSADEKLNQTGDARIAREKAIQEIHEKTAAAVHAAEERADRSREAATRARTPAGQQAAQSNAADAGERSAAHSETGPALGIDIYETRTKAEQLEYSLRTGLQPRDAEHMAQIHNALERMLGLMENQAVTAVQKGDMSGIISRIEALETQVDYHEQRSSGGGSYGW